MMTEYDDKIQNKNDLIEDLKKSDCDQMVIIQIKDDKFSSVSWYGDLDKAIEAVKFSLAKMEAQLSSA